MHEPFAATAIMLIMLPLALPVATALGANLVWFGVVTTIAIEIGLLTPPFGLSVYVIKASMNDSTMTLATIFRGAFCVRADHARRDAAADGVPANKLGSPVALCADGGVGPDAGATVRHGPNLAGRTPR